MFGQETVSDTETSSSLLRAFLLRGICVASTDSWAGGDGGLYPLATCRERFPIQLLWELVLFIYGFELITTFKICPM